MCHHGSVRAHVQSCRHLPEHTTGQRFSCAVQVNVVSIKSACLAMCLKHRRSSLSEEHVRIIYAQLPSWTHIDIRFAHVVSSCMMLKADALHAAHV